MTADLLPLRPHPFGFLDRSVLAVYGAILLGIGFHRHRRNAATNEEFFAGIRRTHPRPAGISLFTVLTSIIAYGGTPGEYMQCGPMLPFLANLITRPIIQVVVVLRLIPFNVSRAVRASRQMSVYFPA